MLSELLLLMTKLTPGISTVAQAVHTYIPPAPVCKGAKVKVLDIAELMPITFSTVPFPILVPSGDFVHSISSVPWRFCARITLQVRVRVSPAVKVPLASTLTTGSAGTIIV